MPMQAFRHLFSSHQAIARWSTRIALCSLATVITMQTVPTLPHLIERPAADAAVARVNASGSPVTVPNVTTPEPAAFTSSWQLANLPNPRVDGWVQRFRTSLKSDLSAALDRGNAYLPMISAKLAARHMPQELAYLPLIESEFRPQAHSPVSAVGLWQFMASTARRFGLTVSRHADERTNAVKETDAALAYLSQLHDRFGSWYLAAAAYNAGPGTVASAMQRVLGRNTGSDADFYSITAHLPAETSNYVPKLIAVARIVKDSSATAE